MDFLKFSLVSFFFIGFFWDVPIFMPFFSNFPEILYFLGFSFFSQLIVLIFYVLKIKSYFSSLRDIFVSKVKKKIRFVRENINIKGT
jgi:hypothetical protein